MILGFAEDLKEIRSKEVGALSVYLSSIIIL
jgi:hypothetical protein